MQLSRQLRAAGPCELVGVDARDQLGLEPRLQDGARLSHAEVAAVTEHVAEPGSRDVRLSAPLTNLLRVCAHASPAVRWQSVRGEERHLDARQVDATAQAREQPHGLELAIVLQVVARLGFDRRGPAVEPRPQPAGGVLLEIGDRFIASRLDSCTNPSASLRDLGVGRARGSHRDLRHAVARVDGMGVGVDQARGHEPAHAVVLFDHGLHEIARLIAVLPTPRDLLAIADDRRVGDHSSWSSREQAADVAQAPHLCTTASPPTTTFVTSWPENP